MSDPTDFTNQIYEEIARLLREAEGRVNGVPIGIKTRFEIGRVSGLRAALDAVRQIQEDQDESQDDEEDDCDSDN